MDCSKLNEIFNCDGPDWLEENEEYEILHHVTFRHTEETKQAISIAKKGCYGNRNGAKNSKKHNERISLANTGKKRTDEFKEEARQRAKGNRNRRKRCLFRGEEFDSMTIAAEHFNCSVPSVSLYCIRL